MSDIEDFLTEREIRKRELMITLRLIWENKSSFLGVIIIVALVVLAILGPLLSPYDPFEQDLANRLSGPSLLHPFGTDEMGRDLLSRILYGARYSLIVGTVVMISAIIIGVLIGLTAGFIGGLVDHILMRVTDVFMAFPSFLLAMAMAAALKPSLTNAMIAIAISWWPDFARLMRGQVLSVKENVYIEAARAAGETNLSIAMRHILPNSIAPIIIKGTMDLGLIILTAAGLSFIGLGAQPPLPEWGAMISTGRAYLIEAPWVSSIPGFFISIAVLGFNLLGDGLRDVYDPRLRGLQR